MTGYTEAAQQQRQHWHALEAVSRERLLADRAEAAWRSVRAAGGPHAALACGHLSPPGSGPLAGAGYGYCPQHGVSRVLAADAGNGSS
jgi:hypothetical protein